MRRQHSNIHQQLTSLLTEKGAQVFFEYTDGGRANVVAIATIPTEQGTKTLASPGFSGTDDSWDDGPSYLHAEDHALRHLCRELNLV